MSSYGKNQAGVGDQWIGAILAEARRRMRVLAAMGVVWAVAWLLVPVAGLWLAGLAAVAMLGLAAAVLGLGACLHGAIQAPLVADLANPRLLGRHTAALALERGLLRRPARAR